MTKNIRLTPKSKEVVAFLDGLHDFITSHPQYRQMQIKKTEKEIQTEIRPLIIRYLEEEA